MQETIGDNINNILEDIHNHQPFSTTCPHCHKPFKKNSKLHRHINESHLNLKPHKCSLCTKDFKRSHHLQRHLLSHSNQRPHKCTHCIKAFISKEHLTRHLKLIHLR